MSCAVILTARSVEYRAVCQYLSDLQEEVHPQGTIYQRGRFLTFREIWEIGLVELGVGNTDAAAAAERAIAHFKPDVILFVGIAGGIKDVALGDVVASSKIYGYESGRAGQSFQPRPEIGLPSYGLEQRARTEARKDDWRLRLSAGPRTPQVHVAPIAAGEKIIDSTISEVFQFLRASYEDAVAVEMEGIGFLKAARANPQVSAMVIRGISTLIDHAVHDVEQVNWQEIAAQNATAFAFEVLSKSQSSISIPIPDTQSSSDLELLALQLRRWFKALDYKLEPYAREDNTYFQWIIQIRSRQNYCDRIVIRVTNEEAGLHHLDELTDAVIEQQADEGWLVSRLRITPAVIEELLRIRLPKIFYFTFDELIDQSADFTPYIKWLKEKVEEQNIEEHYIPLSCKKEELNLSNKRNSISYSNHSDIDKYINQWLNVNNQEHISVIGDFGSGKTWFALHYAWEKLKLYNAAVESGLERPRFPLLITLRDYEGAAKMDTILANFFFSKHNIRSNQALFDFLNSMGKILIIFDGFDEMASQNDIQVMANNFQELANIVVPGSKIILTSRREHFPNADFRKQVLSGRIPSSRIPTRAVSPRFETLELDLFTEEQTRQVLNFYTTPETVEQVMKNQHLLDLVKRPVMVNLVIEALPEVEMGKPVDMARIYFYAAKKKMERDISASRTFTSMADKLYFMCEISWELLSTERPSLNYRDFPDRVRRLFPQKVREHKFLDHWQYDMMGQTFLTRNSEGDYFPAHRSLLEFFVAYKLAAEIGLLHEDFLSAARERADSDIDGGRDSSCYQWSQYWRRSDEGDKIAQLDRFTCESWEKLKDTFGKSPLTKFSNLVIELLVSIIFPEDEEMASLVETALYSLIYATRELSESEIGFIGGNAATILIARNPDSFIEKDLSNTILRGANLADAYLLNTNLNGANLADVRFSRSLGEPVYTIAFNKYSKFFLTGSEDGIVRLWNVEDWQEKLAFENAHDGYITAFAWSHDSTKFASGGDDRKVKIWSVDTQQHQIQVLFILNEHEQRIRTLAWSSDGTRVASGSRDQTIKIWDVQSGDCLLTLTGHQGTVRSLAWSPDDRKILSGSIDKTIKVWDSSNGECLRTLVGHEDWVRSVDWHKDGQRVISSSDDTTIRVWNILSGFCEKKLSGHRDVVRTIAWSPDFQKILSGSDDTTLKIWDFDKGECLSTCYGHRDSIRYVAWSDDNNHIFSSSEDKTISMWNASSGTCDFTLYDAWNSLDISIIPTDALYPEPIEPHNFTVFGDNATVKSVAWSPDGKKVVTGSRDKTIKVWDALSGECLAVLSGHGSTVRSVAWSPDGAYIVSGSRDKAIQIWDAYSYCCIHRICDAHDDWIRTVACSLDGKYIASGSDDKSIKIWHAGTDNCAYTLSGHEKSVRAIAWSPDGSRILSGSDDKLIKIWDTQTGNCIHTLPGHKNWVRSVAWSPDGTKFLSGSRDRVIKIWCAKDIFCISCFSGHESAVRTVAWSPDGSKLLSGSDDKTIKVWDLAANQCILTVNHNHVVTAVAWSPDGSQFLSGSRDKTVKIWDANSGECLHSLPNQIYGGVRIDNVSGLSTHQIDNLYSLGAVNQ
jgi:WD40 repeat protein/nucleoside phosphorylase